MYVCMKLPIYRDLLMPIKAPSGFANPFAKYPLYLYVCMKPLKAPMGIAKTQGAYQSPPIQEFQGLCKVPPNP